MPSKSIAFDRAASYYDETRGFPPGEEAPIAALFAAAGGLVPSSRVLEFGVGTGRIALPLARHVRAIVGIDLARPMLDRLRAKQTGEPVHLAQADATRLPFAPGVFDAAVAVHVFHLIAAWQDVLREIDRVLRPGGVLLNGWTDRSRVEREDVLWQAWNQAVGTEQTRHIGVQPAQFETSFAEQGWRPVGSVQVHVYPVLRIPQQFLERLEQRTWSSQWEMPDDLHARGVAAVRAAIESHQLDPLQPVALAMSFHVQAFLPPEGQGV